MMFHCNREPTVRSSSRPVEIASSDYTTNAAVSPVIQLKNFHLFSMSLFINLIPLSIHPVPVFQVENSSWSVAFSPANPTIVASGGRDGTKLFDIRQNSFRYQNIILMVLENLELNFLINSLIFFIDASTPTQVSMALPARDLTAVVHDCCAGNWNSFPSSTTFQLSSRWAWLQAKRSNFRHSVALLT